MLLHFDSGYSIIIPVTGLGGKKSKPENDSFIYVGGRPCAIGTREPCQAGNRAALSGLPCAPQAACPLYAEPYNGRLAPRPVLFFAASSKGGREYVPCALP